MSPTFEKRFVAFGIIRVHIIAAHLAVQDKSE
jgi:hypothetical protein